MNKKGFTLVEILAVIIILGIIIVVVGTKGFGAFDSVKNAISRENEKAIKEAVNVLMVEVESDACDNLTLGAFTGYSNCISLQTAIKNGTEVNVSYEYLLENGYLAGTNMEDREVYREDTVEISVKKESNKIIVNTNIKENKDTKVELVKLNSEENKYFYPYRNLIKRVIFSDKLNNGITYDSASSKDGTKLKWDISKDGNGKVYAWLEEISGGGLYTLYIASEYSNIYAHEDTYAMFKDFTVLESVEFANFRTDNMTNMRAMFYKCINLKSLDLSMFDTSNVENMWDMFNGCSSLESINLINFNTEKVTTMNSMFRECKKLKSLNLNNFNTSNVENMFCMFYHCESLMSLDVTGFNTEKVQNMSWMFAVLSSLTSLDLSSFNTDSIINIDNLFSYSNKLKSIILCNNELIENEISSGVDIICR